MVSRRDFLRGAFRQREKKEQEAKAYSEQMQAMLNLYKQGAWTEARQKAQQVLVEEPKNQTARLYEGLCWLKENNLEQALTAWDDYFDVARPLVLREVNVVKALVEAGESPDCLETAASIDRILSKDG